jgi:hypothetical protein
VDTTALKVNQAFIIGLLAIAFVLGEASGGFWLVLLVATIMAIGTFVPAAGLFIAFYARVLKPAGLLKPNVIPDDPVPHLFAQGVGAAFLLASVLAFFAFNSAVVGWALAWVVIVLASINLTVGFCLGCFIYYQLSRRGWMPGADIAYRRSG